MSELNLIFGERNDMVWIAISRLIIFIFGVFIGMVIAVRHYEENKQSANMADEECMKCKHHASGGCDTWCENGEAFEPEN